MQDDSMQRGGYDKVGKYPHTRNWYCYGINDSGHNPLLIPFSCLNLQRL